jgi:hypothetical protein
MTTPPKTQHYLVVDIEKLGSGYEHALIAIGAMVGSLESGVLEAREWHLAPEPGQVPEQRCMDEHWSKFPEQLKALQSDAQPFQPTMLAFLAWWDQAQERFPGIRIVSDNPEYDLGQLNWYSKKAQPERRFSMRNVQATGAYLWVEDPSEQLTGLDMFRPAQSMANMLSKITHLPGQDVEHIFWLHVVAMYLRASLMDGATRYNMLQLCKPTVFNRFYPTTDLLGRELLAGARHALNLS